MNETNRIPGLRPVKPLTMPRMAECTLSNGLTIIAIQSPGVPVVEARLRLPFAGVDLAASMLLAKVLPSAASCATQSETSAQLEILGGRLEANVTADRLMISGHVLSPGLDHFLELLASMLTTPSYSSDLLSTEKARLLGRLRAGRSHPTHLVRRALLARLYGDHPYGSRIPTESQVQGADYQGLQSLHSERVRPHGGHLVLLGDLEPEKALDVASRWLNSWTGKAEPVIVTSPPAPVAGPITLVNYSDSVQSSLRLALPVVARTHPDYEAIYLANAVFGGCFSSRWVENLRENKGYSYNPHSMIEHSGAGSVLLASAEVATQVTAPALRETLHELEGIATQAVTAAELEQARQYVLGTLQLGMCTQSGLAGLAAMYAGHGLRLDYLVGHASRLAAVTLEDISRAAERYLNPAKAIVVVLGNAPMVEPSLSTIMPVLVASTDLRGGS